MMNENEYKNIMEKAPVGIFVADENGINLEVNNEACKIIGYTKKELIGKSLMDLVLEEDSEKIYKKFLNLKKRNFGNVDIRCVIKNNINKILNVRSVVLSDNRILNFATDITEKKLLERKNFESENEYRALLDNAGLEIGYYKSDGTIIWYNKVAAQIMGGVPEDFAGKNIKKLFPEKDAKNYMQRIKKAIETKSSLSVL